jgi:hypothetical protein
MNEIAGHKKDEPIAPKDSNETNQQARRHKSHESFSF